MSQYANRAVSQIHGEAAASKPVNVRGFAAVAASARHTEFIGFAPATTILCRSRGSICRIWRAHAAMAIAAPSKPAAPMQRN